MIKTRVRCWDSSSGQSSDEIYESLVSKISNDLQPGGRFTDDVKAISTTDITDYIDTNKAITTDGIFTDGLELGPGTYKVEIFYVLTTTEFNNSGFNFTFQCSNYSTILSICLKHHIGADITAVDQVFDANGVCEFNVSTENSSSPTLIRASYQLKVGVATTHKAGFKLSNAIGNLTLMKGSYARAEKLS